MKEKDLLKQCRYFDGNNIFSDELLKKSDKAFLFWEAEQMFVEQTDTEIEKEAVKQYLAAGLAGANLELPLFLCASLFSIFNKSSDNDLISSAAYFQKYFLPDYIASTRN